MHLNFVIKLDQITIWILAKKVQVITKRNYNNTLTNKQRIRKKLA